MLRRKDVLPGALVIDEAIVHGRIKLKHDPKETPAAIKSAACALEADLIAEKQKLEAGQKGIVH